MDKRGDLRALIALASAMLTVAMGVGFVVPLLSRFADTLGAGGLWMGLIVGANPAIRAAFMPYVGQLSDIRGKKRYLLIGLCGYIVVAALMGLAVNPWQLFLARALQGFFSSMVMPVSQAYAGVLAPKQKEGAVMGSFTISFFLGFALGPLLGGMLADRFGLRIPFLCMAGLTVIALGLVWAFVPDQAASPLKSGQRPDFRTVLSSPIVCGIGCGRLFNAMSRGLFTTMLPLYAARFLNLSGTEIGVVLFTYSLFASILQPVAGALSDRFNRRWLALAGFVLTPVALALVPAVRSFPALIALALVMGLGPGMFVPSSLAIAVVEGRRVGMGSTMGIIEMASGIGMAAGAVLGGAATQMLGLTHSFYVIGGIALLGVVPFQWLLRTYTEDRIASA